MIANRLLPEWARNLTGSGLLRDLSAGITVGIMLVPQSMAYALLAGMPPIYGLYASLVPLVVYALLGSSRHLSVGTTAVDGLIMVFAIGAIATPGSDEFVAIALMFAGMVGMVHVALSLGRLGFLANLLSRPVILGFIAAAATIIGFSQLSNLMGIPLPQAERVYSILYQAVMHSPETHVASLALGCMGIAILVMCRLWNKLFPAALLTVAVGILITRAMRLDQAGVAVLGGIPTGLPSLVIPTINIDAASQLALTAVTLALIQFTNVVSLGKSYAAKHDYPINANRELMAVGLANIAGSFFQSYAVSGSFSRTAINEQAGAKTPLSNLFAAGLVAITLLFLTPLLYYLPVPILASIIMVAAFGMIDIKGMLKLFEIRRSEGVLAIVTFVVTLVFGLQSGIITGIVASVIITQYRMSRPNIAILGNLPGTRSYRDVRVFEEAEQVEGILILRIDASFLFSNVDFVKDMILEQCKKEENDIHSVIIDASTVNDLDTTAVQTLYTLVDRLEERSVDLFITGVHGRTSIVMRRSGFRERLSEERFFLSPHRAVQYIEKQRT